MKSYTRHFIILLAIIGLAFSSSLRAHNDAKPSKGYRIAITIADCDADQLLMGCYYAKSNMAIDTAMREANGRYLFTNDTMQLHPGLYFFATATGKFVEFVVYHETVNFEFTTSGDDWMANMQVRNSKENEVFYEYQNINRNYYKKFTDNAPDTTNREAYAAYRQQMAIAMDSMRNDFVRRNPDRMISRMMLATKEPDVPETDPLGIELPLQKRWEIYAEHYFDNMALEDDFLVRTPRAVFYDRVMTYFDKVMYGASPDIIIPYLDHMLDRAKASRENFHYLLHTLTEKYLQSNIMIYDEIYVHLVLKYYANGDAWWMRSSDIDTEVMRAEKWDKLLVGRIAPELVVYDDHDRPASLHNMAGDYKLLIFWSPTCGHCKVTVPAVYEKYKAFQQRCNIQAMAILTEFDEETIPTWKEFIKEHDLRWGNFSGGVANIDWHDVYDVTSTPQIYLLDKDNKILAKKLNAETFENIMNHLLEEEGK